MLARRWAGPSVIVAVTLLLGALLTGGCGDGGPHATNDATGRDAREAPGPRLGSEPGREAPGPRLDSEPGREAPRSPLDIPPYTNQGQEIDSFIKEIEAHFTSKCGGELCVTIRPELSYLGAGDPTYCLFRTTVPPPGSRVEPGSEIVVKAACGSEPQPGTSEPPTGDESGESPPPEPTP